MISLVTVPQASVPNLVGVEGSVTVASCSILIVGVAASKADLLGGSAVFWWGSGVNLCDGGEEIVPLLRGVVDCQMSEREREKACSVSEVQLACGVADLVFIKVSTQRKILHWDT